MWPCMFHSSDERPWEFAAFLHEMSYGMLKGIAQNLPVKWEATANIWLVWSKVKDEKFF